MEYSRILEELLGREDYLVIGRSTVRVDALDKALGSAKFTADYIPKKTAVVKVLRSSEPHALIKNIDATKAMKISGVISVLTADDVPGCNQVGYVIPDQPFLNKKKVRFVGDPLALLVAEDEQAAFEGLEAVTVEYELLPSSFHIDSTLEEGAPVIHDDGNVAVTTRIRKGDEEKEFAQANVEVEGSYYSPHQEHMYLEPEAAYAIPGPSEKVTVIGCMQSPFLVREKVAQILGWNINQVRIVQALTGGGFGGKDDMGPLICAKAALAAVKVNHPTALVLDREESASFSNKRFPARIQYRSGVNKEGMLTAIEVDITVDCGAYANRAPFWLWRQTAHAAGPYEVPNASVDGRAVYTNKVFGGSFRGFGNVAIQFAAESQMDKLSEELDMDPVELRLKNVLRPGSKTTCDQLLDHSVGMEECLRGVANASQWNKKQRGKGGE